MTIWGSLPIPLLSLAAFSFVSTSIAIIAMRSP
jgi:hypothetical protein